MSLGVPGKDCFDVFSCRGDEPKSGLARDLGDCLQSRNVPFVTSGDCYYVYDKMSEKYKTAQEKICAMRYSRRLQHGKYDKKPADGSFAWDDYYA